MKAKAKHEEPKNIITKEFNTPLGKMIAGVYDKQLCFLDFADDSMEKKEHTRYYNQIKDILRAEITEGESPLFNKLIKELEEYFQGKRKKFTIPLIIAGTPFQEVVWQQLQEIPFGKLITYKEQAEAIGKPKAVRAVANANSMNRIAIIIPCHRVIGSDGTLTGYAGGLDKKRKLIDLEAGKRW